MGKLSDRRAKALARQLERSSVDACSLPPEAAAYAAACTLAAIDRGASYGWSDVAVRAYFNKVARRRVVRRHAHSDAAARLVADCVVADLVGAGRSPRDAYEELERGWTHALPAGVLEEYRERLCA